MTTTDDHDQDGTESSHCDHPACEDEIHKTYHDENDNGLDLCEAHYYWLVSGKKPNSLKTPGIGPALGTLDQPPINTAPPARERGPLTQEPLGGPRPTERPGGGGGDA